MRILTYMAIIVATSITLAGCSITKNKLSDSNSNSQTNQQSSNTAIQSTIPDTSSWKTYKNDEFAVELKYPNEYSPIEERQQGQSEDGKVFTVSLQKGTGPFPLLQIYQKSRADVLSMRRSQASTTIDPIIAESDTTMNGESVHVLSQESATGIGTAQSYFWEKDGRTYEYTEVVGSGQYTMGIEQTIKLN